MRTKIAVAGLALLGPVLAHAAGESAPIAPPQANAPQAALPGYRPYADEPVTSWREANDAVGRIGGWKTYARERDQPPAPSSAPRPQSPPATGAKP